MKRIELTIDDWAEIWAALETKRGLLIEGRYGDDSLTEKWAKHLEKLMTKIGPDGEGAARRGVNPTDDA